MRYFLGLQGIKGAWAILREHAKLWVFPICGILIAGLLYAALCVWYFIEPNLRPNYVSSLTSLEHVILGIVTYLLMYFILAFFNTALASSYLDFLSTKNMSLRAGLLRPWNQLPKLFIWSLFEGSIGQLFIFLSGRALGPGEILSAILGGAWKTLSYFMFLLLSQSSRPLWQDLLANKSLIQKTWGSWVIPRVGLERLKWLLCLLATLPWIIGVFFGSLVTPIGFAITCLLWFSCLSFLSIFDSLLQAARYHYVATAQIAPGWNKDEIVAAFVPHQRAW